MERDSILIIPMQVEAADVAKALQFKRWLFIHTVLKNLNLDSKTPIRRGFCL